MAVILDSDDFMVGTIIDIVIVFMLGAILLVFANALYTDSRMFMLYLALLVISITIYNITYLSKNIEKEKQKKHSYSILIFLQMYMAVLFVFLTIMFYYMKSKYYIQ